ncbi:hypothetical protein KAW1A4500_00007 [Escherichia phage vB_EcoP_KAW1A4500]|uniref:Uncharacterized protein n=1 Tax=Escherichia phage vB_EcoP_KAW1A4500 TaxID=2508205 RepID=A0A482MTT6_9CAUD|nr:hypothetical protein KAW1A4500_00007 [Escherichia phage vB_EcoP_KAW1A4500]
MDLDSIIMAFALIGLSWCSYHLYRELLFDKAKRKLRKEGGNYLCIRGGLVEYIAPNGMECAINKDAFIETWHYIK